MSERVRPGSRWVPKRGWVPFTVLAVGIDRTMNEPWRFAVVKPDGARPQRTESVAYIETWCRELPS